MDTREELDTTVEPDAITENGDFSFDSEDTGADRVPAAHPDDDGWGLDDAPDGHAAAPVAPETFRIKHLGEEVEVTRDEMIRLAQKGRDYDRIRERADSLTDRLRDAEERTDALRTAAAGEGMTAEQYVDRIAAQNLARERGISLAEAERRVRADRARRESALPAERIAERARDREAAEFLREYGGEVSPRDIPAEVWDDVRRGRSLLDAYRAFENRELRRKIADAENRAANERRTTGSRAADGGDFTRGEIESDWYDA